VTRATPVILAIFFAAATILLVVVAISLLAPGSPLDAVWWGSEKKLALLAPYRGLAGPGFLLLAVFMAAAAVGCYRRRGWGWGLAVAVISANAAGDVAQIFAGRTGDGVFGVVIAGVILVWLTTRAVRDQFPLARQAVS
jgi:hypothetical protein